MTAAGGVMGLSLGYYALLWIRGPEGDFLNWSQSLPKAMLPASFSKSSRLLAAAPIVQPEAEELPAEPATEVPEAKADETAKTADTTPIAADAPAEKQATFTEPVERDEGRCSRRRIRKPATATTADKPAEPATFDAPLAEPVIENAKLETPSEPIHIAGAPRSPRAI